MCYTNKFEFSWIQFLPYLVNACKSQICSLKVTCYLHVKQQILIVHRPVLVLVIIIMIIQITRWIIIIETMCTWWKKKTSSTPWLCFKDTLHVCFCSVLVKLPKDWPAWASWVKILTNKSIAAFRSVCKKSRRWNHNISCIQTISFLVEKWNLWIYVLIILIVSVIFLGGSKSNTV